jgi:hypothetical protein
MQLKDKKILPANRQIQVSLRPYPRAKLLKIAEIERSSLSALCALAIEEWIDNWFYLQMRKWSLSKDNNKITDLQNAFGKIREEFESRG